MAARGPHFKSILNRVRERLRSENIKLWLAPYTTSNDEPGKYPEVITCSIQASNYFVYLKILIILRVDFQDRAVEYCRYR